MSIVRLKSHISDDTLIINVYNQSDEIIQVQKGEYNIR